MEAWILGMVLTALVCFLLGMLTGGRIVYHIILSKLMSFERITLNPQINMVSKIIALLRN